MDTTEVVIGIAAGVGTLYLQWRQNKIFEQQNKIFAEQAGVSRVETTHLSQRARIDRYWPMMVMAAMTILIWLAVGYDLYDRHHHYPAPVVAATVPPQPQASVNSPSPILAIPVVPENKVRAVQSDFDKSKLHQALIGPCKKINNLRAYMRDQNPNVTIYLNDPHDPDERNLADKIHDEMLAAGCTYVNSDGAPIDGLIQNYKPFYGIKVWNGYTEMTRASAEALRAAINQLRPGTSIYEAGIVPDGGHFEGIAILIGKLSR